MAEGGLREGSRGNRQYQCNFSRRLRKVVRENICLRKCRYFITDLAATKSALQLLVEQGGDSTAFSALESGSYNDMDDGKSAKSNYRSNHASQQCLPTARRARSRKIEDCGVWSLHGRPGRRVVHTTLVRRLCDVQGPVGQVHAVVSPTGCAKGIDWKFFRHIP